MANVTSPRGCKGNSAILKAIERTTILCFQIWKMFLSLSITASENITR